MNIGSLYRVKKWYWLLFSSKESADAALGLRSPALVATLAAENAAAGAVYYSNKYKENVTYFSPDLYVVFLEEDGIFKKVLTSEGLIGWTWFVKSYNDYFEEVSS